METPTIDRIIRSRRRTLALQITADAQLVVRAPSWISHTAIQNVVNDKLPWIRKRQQIARAARERISPRRFSAGESFLYLGEWRPLEIRVGSDQDLLFDLTGFSLGDRHEAGARARFERWYRAQAEQVITERVRLFAVRSGLAFRGLRISGAKSRWGSCSSKGTLNFSWRLIMAPLWVVDYVVVHELSHLVEHNHSKRFWAHVARYFPDYTNARRWLRENQQLLEI